MQHLLIAKAILAVTLSTGWLVLPQYCTEHKTVDFCWIEHAEPKGGPEQSKH